MSLIVLGIVVYVGLYVVLSIPSMQNKIKEKVCNEASLFLGGRLDIESLVIRPFSEVILMGASLSSTEGEECARIGKVAAGIDLWALFAERKIILNYAEILGMDISVIQKEEGAPLNIQFLIDALSPKDKNKPSAEYDIRIRNIVVRDSKASFSRPWMKDDAGGRHKLAEIDIDRLRIDLSIPVLKNDQYRFDIRNLQFDASPGVSVRSLTADIQFIKESVPHSRGADRLMVKDLELRLPKSSLTVGDVNLQVDSLDDIPVILDGYITPCDFSELLPDVSSFDSRWNIKTAMAFRNKKEVDVSEFLLENPETNSSLSLKGRVEDIGKKDSLDIRLEELNADLSAKVISEALSVLPQMNDGKGRHVLESAGRIRLDLEGNLKDGDVVDAKGSLITDCGSIGFNGLASRLHSDKPKITLLAEAEDIELGKLLSTDRLGHTSMCLDVDITGLDEHAEGNIKLKSDECSVMGYTLAGVELELNKLKENIELSFDAFSESMSVNLDSRTLLAGKDTQVEADLYLSGLDISRLGVKGKLADCKLSGHLKGYAKGNSADNMTGALDLDGFAISRPDGDKLGLAALTVNIDSLHSESSQSDKSLLRDIRIGSDWLDARICGDIHPGTIAREIKGMIGSVFPTLIPAASAFAMREESHNDFTFDINIKGTSAPYSFFDTPVRPLADIPVKGSVDSRQGKININFSTPHLQQGKNKLIRDVLLSLDLDAFLGMAKMNAALIFPAKKGDAELAAEIYAMHDKVDVILGINPTLESVVKGNVALSARFSRRPDPFKPQGELAVMIGILPSTVTVNDKVWSIAESEIDYSGKRIAIDHFLLAHDDQFVSIDGSASERVEDVLKVRVNDIDLEYIFNLLNINYVSFGGMATGEIVGARLLTKTPDAKTEYLRVKDLSYNGAVIGDGDLASEYDAVSKKVGIYAVVRDPLTRERKASIEGGIWVTRDSLSFGFDARKINVAVMKPFVSAFCSDLYGEASGKCRLYGTFSDIDLVGDLKADTVSMNLVFTNTWYHAGNDSVFLHKGEIEVPPLTLYDDEHHTAEFSGWLRHRYFHEPVFCFKLKDARSLLCYNTNEKINPLWYGTIYGSGHAQINGAPGLIDIDMNMTTEEGSRFYYIISDAEDVAQYTFLTFTDKIKERQKAADVDSVPDYLMKFRKNSEDMASGSSNVILSLKGTVTNDAVVTLVMDPRAGDNITARGQGALQMDYNLAGNDLRMIGTYVLDEGNYNFTLQDIIIKNFNIRKGSSIKFDGDPMKAILDIAATYRVNTNLTDLDKSFSTDKELNRTNVPVDAVLLVDGPMTNPDITFDIELPTLTSDVERKVKSIVSTNDMMSRQIIYLLALNRFYTPEYTGGQSNGSEWSSMASSTISSQLSNILSQMTDKLDVAPSFRSEKGDFSDMEFDLALSSRLLNNRLLINGNFGYRDRSTSNTQFVGDFDIEYLLNKSGNLRLKAYNHFNDQNYYLRSALTTQGVGVVFRRDFDRLFRRKKKNRQENQASDLDSLVRTEKENENMMMVRDSIGGK